MGIAQEIKKRKINRNEQKVVWIVFRQKAPGLENEKRKSVLADAGSFFFVLLYR